MYTSESTKYSARTDIGQTSRILVVEDEELIQEMRAIRCLVNHGNHSVHN